MSRQDAARVSEPALTAFDCRPRLTWLVTEDAIDCDRLLDVCPANCRISAMSV